MTNETLDFLRKKASMLPKTPGIYLMKDRTDKIIYVGKSSSLKDRVSQYFHLTKDANIKTLRMVSQVCDFETILCDTEIEALTLENVKIKQFNPKYNILLKDSKSYPYIKVTMNEKYPKILMTRKRLNDGARYFGPYSGASVVYGIIGTLERTLGIPTCKKSFPKDIGKERPCIYKQMGRCVAPCDNTIKQKEFYGIMKCAVDILRGNIKDAVEYLSLQMSELADEERYEEAARCRDNIEALKKLRDSQKVVGSPKDEYDIISTFSNDVSTCISVFYVRSGVIVDSDNFVYGAMEIITEDGYEQMSHFLTDLYSKREYIPKEILLGFEFDESELQLVQTYLQKISGRAIKVRVPQKGDCKKLCNMVAKNAEEHVKQYTNRIERDNKVLVKLAEMLSLDCVPNRIEAYDISNLGNEHITAGMIVYEDGKFQKKDYRTFKIKGQDGADDYSAMKEAIKRRIANLADNNSGFSTMPDLLLIDGGATHVSAVNSVLKEENISIPAFGMVKDEHHKTRTLVTENNEISIAKEQSVFVFVYKIQEEVHRFTVSKMDGAKRKTLKKSLLENVQGIGKSKAKAILAQFKTLSAIKKATADEISKVKGISYADAVKILEYLKEIKV